MAERRDELLIRSGEMKTPGVSRAGGICEMRDKLILLIDVYGQPSKNRSKKRL